LGLQGVVRELVAVGGFQVEVGLAALSLHLGLYKLQEVSVARSAVMGQGLVVIEEDVAGARVVGALASEAGVVHFTP
jgi:hypothetical protein